MNIENISEEQIRDFVQNEQVWYYSDESNFKGPFTDNEIFQAISKDTINSSAKMWSKKYDFWIPILEVKKFASAISARPPKAVETKKSVEISDEEFTWKNSDEFWKYMEQNHPHLNYKPLFDAKVQEGRAVQRRPVWLAIAAGFIVSAVIGISLYSNSSRPELPHRLLNKQQNSEAQSVRQSLIKKYGIRTKAFFVDSSTENLNIVMATNLNDGSSVKVIIEGLSDTLVGGFEYTLNKTAMVKDGYAELSNVRPSFQGEYQVSVQCDKCLDVNVFKDAVLYREKVFLGGIKDKQYDLSLLRYHTDLRNQVREELDSINQLDEVVNAQFNTLGTGKIDAMWNQLQTQIEVEQNTMNEKAAQGRFFYKEILAVLNKNFEIVKSLRTTTNRDAVATLKKDFMMNSATIKRTTDEMIKMPLSSNGMPQKSGL